MSAALRLPVIVDDGAAVRPRTRGECQDGERPCPWVSCAHHLLPGLLEEGSGRVPRSDDAVLAALETMPHTCALDVADEGGAVLESVGEAFGVTRERARQIEAKALKRVLRRVGHLHDEITEEHDRELRPRGGGEARPIEGVRRHEPPTQHARLSAPGDVTDAAQPFWCPWMGAALTGGLCSKRHTARLNSNAYKGVAGGPLYPGCARCEDGAAVARRLGAVGELVPLRVAVPANRIDWMGEGDDPAETDTAPTAMGAEEPIVKVQRKDMPAAARAATSGGVRAPAPGETCAMPGCSEPRKGYRGTLDASLRPLCGPHRQAVMRVRCDRHLGTAEALAVVRGREEPAATEGPGAAATAGDADVRALHATAEGAERERDLAVAALARVREDLERAEAALRDRDAAMQSLRDESDWLLRQRDAARAEASELRRDRDALTLAQQHAAERIAELEGQQLADATVRVPRPLARLAALAKVLIPDDTIGWTVGGTRDGSGQYCAAALGDERTASWESVAATPDEALAGLVSLVEDEARARIEALTAALGGA